MKKHNVEERRVYKFSELGQERLADIRAPMRKLLGSAGVAAAILVAYGAQDRPFVRDEFIAAGRDAEEREALASILDHAERMGTIQTLEWRTRVLMDLRDADQPQARIRLGNLVDARELARLRGWAYGSVWVLVRRGRLPHRHAGRRVLFDPQEVENYYAGGGYKEKGEFICETCAQRRG